MHINRRALRLSIVANPIRLKRAITHLPAGRVAGFRAPTADEAVRLICRRNKPSVIHSIPHLKPLPTAGRDGCTGCDPAIVYDRQITRARDLQKVNGVTAPLTGDQDNLRFHTYCINSFVDEHF